jgi:uncharacterized membrane protein
MSSLRSKIILVAAVIGLGDSVYLTYVHYAHVSIVCIGGGCDTVNSSPYSQLFGIPVAILGLLGYLLMGGLAAWSLRTRDEGLRPLIRSALLGVALMSWLFAIYLTYLELFVIYAICTWCVISAIDLTLILILASLAVAELFRTTPIAANQAKRAKPSGRATHRE